MPPSNEHSGSAPPSFRSEAEMLAVVVGRAEHTVASRRRKRRMLAAGVAALVAVVLGTSVALALRDDGEDTGPADRVEAEDPVVDVVDEVRPEGWLPLSDSPLSPRVNAVSAWSGEELLVWGGEGYTTDTCRPTSTDNLLCGEPARYGGAAYDPSTDTWRTLAESPLTTEEGSRFHYEGVWTGSELVIWGGPEGQGAAYDPAADSWRAIADAGWGGRMGFSIGWTGEEVIVAGGSERRDPSARGLPRGQPTLAYDPELDRWRELPPLKVTSNWMVMVVSDRVVVAQGDDTSSELAVELFYDSESASWMPAGGPPLSTVRAGVGLGPEKILIAGSELRTDPETGEVDWPAVGRLVSYDPFDSDGTWTDLGDVPGAREVDRLERIDETTAFALSGSSMDQGGEQVIWVVDAAGTWSELPYSGLDDVEGAAVAWTGTELLVWGGGVLGGYGYDPRDVGARYSPGPGGFG